MKNGILSILKIPDISLSSVVRRNTCAERNAISFRIAIVVAFAVAGAITTGGIHVAAAAGDKQTQAFIASWPKQLNKNCRNGRAKLYDECGDQLAIFKAAVHQAQRERKVLLVSYGAEWCIWCHVFDKYIRGERTRFKYVFEPLDEPGSEFSATLYEREKADVSAKANGLSSFVSRSFVIVHIDSQFAPNGHDVLALTGADRYYEGGLPYIFTVGANGRFAAKLDHDRVEKRRDGWWDWFRGFHRDPLLLQLSEMRKAALSRGSESSNPP